MIIWFESNTTSRICCLDEEVLPRAWPHWYVTWGKERALLLEPLEEKAMAGKMSQQRGGCYTSLHLLA